MANTPSFSVAQVLRTGFDRFLQRFGPCPAHYYDVVNAIIACRTPAAGAHRLLCPACSHEIVAFNSCRNRHCPTCQTALASKWVDARSGELLPLPYFHIVFTLPHELNTLALQNKETFYSIFFQAVSQTLLQLAADPKRLGATIGFFAILHTWSQTLMDHFHLHIVVPGGGICPDGKRFKRSRPDFIFPIKVMSALFKGKMIALLKEAVANNSIHFLGSLDYLCDPIARLSFFDTLYAKEFIVYAKPAFAGPRQVVQYLSRYTHRIAISDYRIKDISTSSVSFSWRDRDDGNTEKIMTLPIEEFIRRFLLHVLPPHFVKIRYFGLLANRQRKKMILLCRTLLDALTSLLVAPVKASRAIACPCCHAARMLFAGTISMVRPPG